MGLFFGGGRCIGLRDNGEIVGCWRWNVVAWLVGGLSC